MASRHFTQADQTLIDEYLNECNEDHSLEISALYQVNSLVRHRFKDRNWSKESREYAVRSWMERNTMSPEAVRKACQGALRDMSFSTTPEYKEKLRVAALNRWAKHKGAKHLL